MTQKTSCVLLPSLALGLMLAIPVQAADSTDNAITELQTQINVLQRQINEFQHQQEAQKKAAPVIAEPTSTTGSQKEILPGVKMKLGGYAQAAGIWREKNQVQDSSTSWNGNAANTTGIPFDNNVNAHQSEFRGSARASRLSLLTEGQVDKSLKLSVYVEGDFIGAAPTANSIETNSYTPRLRHAFSEVNHNDWGLKFVGGQTYSLTVLNKSGIDTFKTLTTIGIDSGDLPGVLSTRIPQIRLVKSFYNNAINVGVSAESPQVSFGQVTVPTSIVTATNPGNTSSLNPTAQYSSDLAPDIVTKIAYDSGFGHYELFGTLRFFHDELNTDFHGNVVMASGGGLGAAWSFLAKKLDVQASFIGGEGIGRYSSDKFPDFAFAPNGAIKPLTKYSGVIGLIGHPDPSWDLYTYASYAKVFRKNEANTLFGYGDYALDNSGCYVNGGTCRAQTSSLWQVSPGFWKRLYSGSYGTMQVGAQYSLTRRNAFDDANGNAPHAYQNVLMTALRYAPFK